MISWAFLPIFARQVPWRRRVSEFVGKVPSFSDLISEMSEVLEARTGYFADLLEYEFVPACEDWRVVAIPCACASFRLPAN